MKQELLQNAGEMAPERKKYRVLLLKGGNHVLPKLRHGSFPRLVLDPYRVSGLRSGRSLYLRQSPRTWAFER